MKIIKEQITKTNCIVINKWILLCLVTSTVLRLLSFTLIQNSKTDLLLVLFPLAVVGINNLKNSKNKIAQNSVVSSALISSTVVYLISLNIISNEQFQSIFIYIVVSLVIIYIFYLFQINNRIKQFNNEKLVYEPQNKPLFMIYYLNFAKTYDFVTLINNKFKVNIDNEKSLEIIDKNDYNFGLSNISTGINGGINSSLTKSKSEKILENFEIKNTKSTHLQEILIHANEGSEEKNLKEGSLVKFSNVKLESQDQNENIEAIKLILSGALSGFNIKGQEEGMDFELNLSSLINSFLSEYEYQLTFKYHDRIYYITIPLTGNNDFENDYTVNDLLTGKVTIVGVFKGNYDRCPPFANTLFNLNIENNDSIDDDIDIQSPIGGLTQSEYQNYDTSNESNDVVINDNLESNDVDNNELYIDVISVIQEVHFDDKEVI